MNKKKLIFWIILGIVVVGVVLAILFVTLFGNKDTKALAENLNSYTTSEGYLCSTSERNQKIDAYFDETFSLLSGDDANEVKNYKAIYENYEKISSYFNKEIAYMNYNNTYKSKRGEIERNLKDAQNAVDNLIKKVEENAEIITDNNLKKIVWQDNKSYAKEFVEKTISAFNTLADVYTDCVSSTLLNNSYSKANFIVLKNLSSDILKNITKENVTTTLTSFTIVHFSDAGTTRIINFACNQNEKTKIDDVAKNGNKSEFYDDFVEGLL